MGAARRCVAPSGTRRHRAVRAAPAPAPAAGISDNAATTPPSAGRPSARVVWGFVGEISTIAPNNNQSLVMIWPALDVLSWAVAAGFPYGWSLGWSWSWQSTFVGPSHAIPESTTARAFSRSVFSSWSCRGPALGFSALRTFLFLYCGNKIAGVVEFAEQLRIRAGSLPSALLIGNFDEFLSDFIY